MKSAQKKMAQNSRSGLKPITVWVAKSAHNTITAQAKLNKRSCAAQSAFVLEDYATCHGK